jgi:hypothetical protein
MEKTKTQSVSIPASSSYVFDFIADPETLPQHSLTSAVPQRGVIFSSVTPIAKTVSRPWYRPHWSVITSAAWVHTNSNESSASSRLGPGSRGLPYFISRSFSTSSQAG